MFCVFGVVMKKLLITGFDPFGNQEINPSWESVKNLPEEIGEYRIEKLMIPTVFGKAYQKVIEKAEQINPSAIICVGLAGGRKSITVETVAINLKEANISDNEGNTPVNENILTEGENAYFSTLPIRDIVKKIRESGIDANLSFSAGAFVCNENLYLILDKYKNTDVKVGFIHLPFLPEQAQNGQPSMPMADMVKALKVAIETIQ